MYCVYQSFTYHRSVPRFHSFIIAHIITIKKRIRGYWNTIINNDKQRKRVKLFVQAHVLIISRSSWWRRSGNPSVFAINGRHLIGRCCDKRGFTVYDEFIGTTEPQKTKKGHKSRCFWSEMRQGGPYFRLLGDQEKIFGLFIPNIVCIFSRFIISIYS